MKNFRLKICNANQLIYRRQNYKMPAYGQQLNAKGYSTVGGLCLRSQKPYKLRNPYIDQCTSIKEIRFALEELLPSIGKPNERKWFLEIFNLSFQYINVDMKITISESLHMGIIVDMLEKLKMDDEYSEFIYNCPPLFLEFNFDNVERIEWVRNRPALYNYLNSFITI